jgi:hypothetical protein
MRTALPRGGIRRRVGIALITAGLTWGCNRQQLPTSSVFTPAHASLAQAAQHFFGIRPEPQQPIEYTHSVHVKGAGMKCEYCHDAVSKGPVAHFPSASLCMSCHEEVATDKPSIKKLAAYFEKGQEPPWQRVYGWNEEAHVRFNHAPHIRASVDCAKCHGDVAQMTVARRAVDHTMGFCVTCHTERKASVDCLTCHY